MKDVTDGFMEFLKEYKILGLAIAVVIGNTTKDLVNAAVDGLIMPLIGIVLPVSAWEEYTLTVMTAEIQTGQLLAAALDFLIIAFLIYLFVRMVLKREEVKKI
jgi:large conductance mechanosensitive channel